MNVVLWSLGELGVVWVVFVPGRLLLRRWRAAQQVIRDAEQAGDDDG